MMNIAVFVSGGGTNLHTFFRHPGAGYDILKENGGGEALCWEKRSGASGCPWRSF